MKEEPKNCRGSSQQGAISWELSTPEAHGVDSRALLHALDIIQDRKFNLHSLHMIRAGRLVLDVTFWPYHNVWAHDLASVTKSFTSTLIGIAIDKGYIPSVQARLLDLLPGRVIHHLDERKRSITLEHLLTMSSGLECANEPTELTLEQMWQSADWAQFMLDLPMADAPGSSFKYSSGGSHLLSAILTEATQKSACEFAWQHLFGPLGFQEATWPSDSHGRNHGWGDLMITPYDMAKLGYLFLNKGRLDGQGIVSPQWIQEATTPRLRPEESRQPFSGYGYQWWTMYGGTFVAVGRGGQRIWVAPARDAVIITTAALPRHLVRELDYLVLNEILLAARSPTPIREDGEALAALQARALEMARPPAALRAVAPPPETTKRISGRTYALENAPFGLSEMSLDFPAGDEALLTLTLGGRRSEARVGLDGTYRLTASGLMSRPGIAKGMWQNDRTFALEYRMVTAPTSFAISITFDGDLINVHFTETTGLGDSHFNGRAI